MDISKCALVVAIACVVAADTAAVAQDKDFYPGFYSFADAFVLDRTNNADQQAIVLNVNTNQVLLSTRDLDFNFRAGPRVGFGYQDNSGFALEGIYFGTQQWDSGVHTIQGMNDLRLPGDIALATFDFFGADRMRVDYTSTLHSAEANVKYNTGLLSYLSGFRFVNIDEGFSINSFDVATGTSDYKIATTNKLFGGQIGVVAQQPADWIGWEAFGKIGAYGNVAAQSTLLQDFNNTLTVRNSRTTGGNVAFVGELGASAILRMTGAWSLRAGYNVLWVEGIALAPNQLDYTATLTSGTALHVNGGALFHGANLGIERRW